MLLTASALAGCNNQVTVENYDQQVDELYNKMSQEERWKLLTRFLCLSGLRIVFRNDLPDLLPDILCLLIGRTL